MVSKKAINNRNSIENIAVNRVFLIYEAISLAESWIIIARDKEYAAKWAIKMAGCVEIIAFSQKGF